jgi:aminocarboxymuconate-semialdehyde decarboxylase
MWRDSRKMIKVDIHTHIIPDNLPDFTKKFGYEGFVRLDKKSETEADMILFDENFRTISCNCWNPQTRLLEMTNSDIDVQVISPIPIMFSYWADPKDALEQSRLINDFISNVCQKYPKRFVGLGTIPLQSINYSLKELERCKNELNLKGIEIGSNINDQNLNEEQFLDIFAACEDLSMSVFIHPWQMMGMSKMKKYWLPWLVGMPAETTRAICSMIFGGVFDKFPNLRVAFAHGGGNFHYTLGRIEQGFIQRPDLCAVNNSNNPREYIDKFYIDSLVHSTDSLKFLIDNVGAKQIALGTDYPFPLGETTPGEIIDGLKSITEEDKGRLFHGTAFEWLNLDKNQFI